MEPVSAQELSRTARLFDTPGSNCILSALPPEALDRLRPHLERVSLDLKEILHNPNEPIHWIYFPLNAVCSVLKVLEDGDTVEVGTIGNEGFIGVPIVLGTDRSPSKTICQIPGDACRIKVTHLHEQTRQGGEFQLLLLRYTQQFINQIAQTAACNRAHPVEERCARWLLMTHDRVGRDQFPLTQEFLAFMLGVRRPTVSLAAGMLKEAGLIDYTRGTITILDREELEQASCECYKRIRQEFDRQIPG